MYIPHSLFGVVCHPYCQQHAVRHPRPQHNHSYRWEAQHTRRQEERLILVSSRGNINYKTWPWRCGLLLHGPGLPLQVATPMSCCPGWATAQMPHARCHLIRIDCLGHLQPHKRQSIPQSRRLPHWWHHAGPQPFLLGGCNCCR